MKTTRKPWLMAALLLTALGAAGTGQARPAARRKPPPPVETHDWRLVAASVDDMTFVDRAGVARAGSEATFTQLTVHYVTTGRSGPQGFVWKTELRADQASRRLSCDRRTVSELSGRQGFNYAPAAGDETFPGEKDPALALFRPLCDGPAALDAAPGVATTAAVVEKARASLALPATPANSLPPVELPHARLETAEAFDKGLPGEHYVALPIAGLRGAEPARLFMETTVKRQGDRVRAKVITVLRPAADEGAYDHRPKVEYAVVEFDCGAGAWQTLMAMHWTSAGGFLGSDKPAEPPRPVAGLPFREAALAAACASEPPHGSVIPGLEALFSVERGPWPADR